MGRRIKHIIVQWGVALGLGVAMPSPGAEATDREPVARGPELFELEAVGGATSLNTAYRLSVVDVPDAPELPAPTQPVVRPAPVCPLQVRAIIQGDDDTFAIVVVGDSVDSAVVRIRDTLQTSAGPARVTAIDSDHISVRFGEIAVRCDLRPRG